MRKQMKKETIELMNQAYLAGFNASGEGYNAEYPFQDNEIKPEKDIAWKRNRDRDISLIIEIMGDKK